MPLKGKKKATARRQEPPRQPERRQEPPRQPERRQEPPRQPERRQEPPRQPERRQETADRFTLVLPPELSNLPDRKSTRLNSSHSQISYAVFCLKKKNNSHAVSVCL